MDNQFNLKNIPVLDIYLNPDNPRHDPLNDQSEIIAALLKDEKVKNLARDIVKMGGTSPLELTGVVKEENGHYVVVEGNRRICALTLLNNPTKCPTGEKPYFEKLVKSAKFIPNTILCQVFDEHNDAKPWIDRRHNGEQDGVGVKSWDATQKARAQENPRDAIAYTLIKHATESGIWKQNGGRGKKILTTATRYFGNPKFRQSFGIVSGPREKDVRINVEKDGFDKALNKFFTDIITANSNVDSRQNVSSIEEYVDQFLGGKNALKRTKKIYSILSGAESTSGTGGKGSAGGKNSRSPDTRKKIFPSSVKLTITNPILKRIYDEVRLIDPSKFTIASVMILRCFLENVFEYYIDEVMGQTPFGVGKKHKNIIMIIDEINPNRAQLNKEEGNAFNALKIMSSQKDHLLSPKRLGFYAHGGSYPDPIQIKREWDNISAIILYLLKEIETTK